MRTKDGRATWAIHGFTSLMLGSVERTNASAVVVGFDDHTHSVRKAKHPIYKATRSEKPVELTEQITGAISMLSSARICVVVPNGLEADDVLASASETGTAAGWRTVIVTSDRDSFALIDEHTSVLRLLNGGVAGSPILTADRLHTMYGVYPHQYRDFAAMRGDTSDNLTGIRGIGAKTAAKLLAHYGSTQAAFDAIDTDPGQVVATLGKAAALKLAYAVNRAAFATTSEIMTMRTDVDLGLELDIASGRGRLPLAAEPLKNSLAEWELRALQQQAMRTLTGATAIPQTQMDPYAGLEIPLGPEPLEEQPYDVSEPDAPTESYPTEPDQHPRPNGVTPALVVGGPSEIELTLF